MSLDDIRSSMQRVVGSMDGVRAMSELERAVERVTPGDAFGLGELWAHLHAVEWALRGKAAIFQSRVADVRGQLNKKQRG